MEYGFSFQPKYLFETKIMANHNIKLIKIFMLGFNDIFVNNENNLTSSQLFLFSIYMIKNDLNKHWKQKCIKTTGFPMWNPSKLPKSSNKKCILVYIQHAYLWQPEFGKTEFNLCAIHISLKVLHFNKALL